MPILTLDDAKAAANVDFPDDDVLIQSYVDAAGIWIERVTGKTFDTAPEDVKQAARMLVAHWYDHRASVADTGMVPVPMGVRMLLASRRSFAHGDVPEPDPEPTP